MPTNIEEQIYNSILNVIENNPGTHDFEELAQMMAKTITHHLAGLKDDSLLLTEKERIELKAQLTNNQLKEKLGNLRHAHNELMKKVYKSLVEIQADIQIYKESEE
jgi:hypothetical protein